MTVKFNLILRNLTISKTCISDNINKNTLYVRSSNILVQLINLKYFMEGRDLTPKNKLRNAKKLPASVHFYTFYAKPGNDPLGQRK